MNFLNNDFAEATGREANTGARAFRQFYLSTNPSLPDIVLRVEGSGSLLEAEAEHGKAGVLATLFWNAMVLSQRSAVNYSRNLLAYGVRAGMYAGASSCPILLTLQPIHLNYRNGADDRVRLGHWKIVRSLTRHPPQHHLDPTRHPRFDDKR
jgi:hypothetical protein